MGQEESTPVGVKISGVLKKFKAKSDGSTWSDEEIEAGLAEDFLYEVITFADGEVTEIWKKEN